MPSVLAWSAGPWLGFVLIAASRLGLTLAAGGSFEKLGSTRLSSDRMAHAGEICAYCGEPVLTGEEKPEHPIPAALGSSFVVDTVCDPCNEWAGKKIDQPFLEDDWARVHRSQSGVVDPRRGRRGRPISSPILQGYTEDGDFISLDQDGKPRLRSRIDDLGDGRYQIRTDSMEEMERLKRRVERQTGKKITDDDVTHSSSKPRISFRIGVDLLIWLREAAKIGLAVGSEVYPEEWRVGPDAARLREWLRGEDALLPAGQPIGLVPREVPGSPIELLVDGGEHLLFFQPARGMTFLTIVLLGSVFVSIPVASSGGPAPRSAWRLDPERPKADGRTTLDMLQVEALPKILSAEFPDTLTDAEPA
jgi:hypothetical protein